MPLGKIYYPTLQTSTVPFVFLLSVTHTEPEVVDTDGGRARDRDYISASLSHLSATELFRSLCFEANGSMTPLSVILK